MIKAIETEYAGCRFRSRLEARWAVFFDALGIRWEYEPEGFETGAGRYLPDFLLPTQRTWVEVKGDRTQLDHARMAAFVTEVEPTRWTEAYPSLVVLGDIPRPGRCAHPLPVHALDHSDGKRVHPAQLTDPGEWAAWLGLDHVDPDAARRRWEEANGRAWTDPDPVGVWHSEAWLLPPDPPSSPEPAFVNMPIVKCLTDNGRCKHDLLSVRNARDRRRLPAIDDACTAARSARFEHGQRG